jgi:hypothetical protein
MHVHDFGVPDLIVVLVVAILLIWGGKFGPAIQAIKNLFRGGPRPPSQPLGSDDSKILNRHLPSSRVV